MSMTEERLKYFEEYKWRRVEELDEVFREFRLLKSEVSIYRQTIENMDKHITELSLALSTRNNELADISFKRDIAVEIAQTVANELKLKTGNQ